MNLLRGCLLIIKKNGVILMDDMIKELNKHLHNLELDDYYGEDDDEIDWFDY